MYQEINAVCTGLGPSAHVKKLLGEESWKK
jgi:hypothetical protein